MTGCPKDGAVTMIDYYPQMKAKFKNAKNQIITDWGPPYPPIDYAFGELALPEVDYAWADVPRSLHAPPTIGYPRFVPELQDRINKGEIEIRFKGTKHQYRRPEPTLFDERITDGSN